MKINKRATAVMLAAVTGVLAVSCGKVENEAPPKVPYTDASTDIPDGFVFPGESVESTADKEDSASLGNKETATEAAEYLSEFIDIAKYKETVIDNDSGYSLYCQKDQKDEGSALPESLEILVGKENARITLPSSADAFADAGFSIVGDINGDTQVSPGEIKMMTVCTPDTKEIIGLSAQNSTKGTKTLSELVINRVLLTSLNNFTVAGDICGTSDIKAITAAFGDPDIIAISASGDECSIMLEYGSDSNALLVLADGNTKSVIALDISSK